MSWLSRIFPNDRELAATKYAGRESASELAARKKKTKARVTRAIDSARAGQAWEDADRRRRR
nr:hypothetical protein OG781_41540 [Streptomyces sp. NBC_00830]